MLTKIDIINWWNKNNINNKTNHKTAVKFVKGDKAPEFVGRKTHYCLDKHDTVKSTRCIEVGDRWVMYTDGQTKINIECPYYDSEKPQKYIVEIEVNAYPMNTLNIKDLDNAYLIKDKELIGADKVTALDLLTSCNGWCYKCEVKV